jgi:hypothetical protein
MIKYYLISNIQGKKKEARRASRTAADGGRH